MVVSTIRGRSPHEILATAVAALTGHADDGKATRALELAAPSLKLGPPEAARDIETLRVVMEQREAAPYETRHSVGWPVVYEAEESRIRGRAIVTIHRLTDGAYSLSAADFHVTLIADGERWLIDHLQIRPFVARRIEEGSSAPASPALPLVGRPRLFRTTEGWFIRRGGKIYPVPGTDLPTVIQSLGKATGEAATPLEGDAPGTPLAPVAPARLFLIGLNYKSHADEFGITPPDHIVFGEIPSTGIVASGSTLVHAGVGSDMLDYEGEIAVVLGKDCSKVDKAQAAQAVIGITACNDLSARDLQTAAFMAARGGAVPDMSAAKGFAGAKPIGPEIILTEGLDPARLDVRLKTVVNGEVRQDGNMTELLFAVPDIIAYMSKSVDLKAGDVILTGTPAGVGHAAKRYLKPGDRVEIHLGELDPLVTVIA
jgi:2-keto-4-pentenoate hydratase/2-oxohepta-3-ene-1,7-dioic acid hydratase in catechol pathway